MTTFVLADFRRDRDARPDPIPLPALTHIGVYDLARLFREDRDTALKLAGENAAHAWATRRQA